MLKVHIKGKTKLSSPKRVACSIEYIRRTLSQKGSVFLSLVFSEEKVIVKVFSCAFLNLFEMEPRRQVAQDLRKDRLIFNWIKLGEAEPRVNARFRRIERRATYKVAHNLDSFENLYDVAIGVDSMFESIMQPHLEMAVEADIISINISHARLDSDIFIPPIRKQSFNREVFLDKLFQIAQSNKEYLLDGEFTVTIAVMMNIHGKGKLKNEFKAPKKLYERSKNKLSVVVIKNRDNSCFLRALAISIFVLENGKSDKRLWDKIRRDSDRYQEDKARELGRRLGVEWNKAVGRDSFHSIQEKLTQYQLIIVDGRCPRNLVFKGPSQAKAVFLEYIDEFDGEGHYNAITNIRGYMLGSGGGHYCKDCHVAFKDIKNHSCDAICPQCRGFPKCNNSPEIHCIYCKRIFFGDQCLQNHKENKLCAILKKCEYCDREYREDKGHECETFTCEKCGDKYRKQPHYCYIKGLDKHEVQEEDSIPKIFVAYDIESSQMNGRHKANLVICKIVCDVCWDECYMHKTSLSCSRCGLGIMRFFGDDCITKFCNYLFEDLAVRAEKIPAKVFAFAHNARGYDAHFLLQDLWKRGFEENNIILQGRKILRLKSGNVNMIDSLAFFLQPLSALPKAFGLNIDLAKGYFPHLFNLPENYSYIGPMPELKYYGIENMKPDAANKLMEWYDVQVEKNSIFNFMEELFKYCENDVDILIKSIISFERM